MSELEFQRELSPDQIREALSLLDSTAGVQVQNVEVGDSGPAEKVDPGADQASTTTAPQDRLPAAEDPQQRTKHLNLVIVAFCGLGIAAATTLLWWSERALRPPLLPGIAREQLQSQPAAQLVKSASPALPANSPLDQSSGGSERRPLQPEVAGSSHVGRANRDDDQAAVKDAANSANAIPYAGKMATVNAPAPMQAWWDERASRKPTEAWWHARAVRVAKAKKRFWRRYWQARAEINRGEWRADATAGPNPGGGFYGAPNINVGYINPR